MYGAITQHQFTDAVLKGTLKGVFMQSVDTAEKLWKQIGFEEMTTDTTFEEFSESSALGLPSHRLELQQAEFDGVKQGATTRLEPLAYGINMIVSKEANKNPALRTKMIKGAKAIGDSLATACEILAADVFANAFSTTAGLMADGYCLCSDSHVTPRGDTFSTTLGALSFTDTSLETLLITADKMPASNGLPGKVKVTSLLGPTEYKFKAKRILNSELESSSANNAINALKGEGLKYIANRYLASTTNWFGNTKVENGLVCLWAEKPNTEEYGVDAQRAVVYSGNMAVIFRNAGNARSTIGSSVGG